MIDDGESAVGQQRPSLLDSLRLRDDTALPLYRQLEQQLTTLIENGSLVPGTTLPAERQLAEKLGISRVTVQRSYNALRQRKLLTAHGRLGSIVQENPLRLNPGLDRLKGFTEEMREIGRVPSSKILERKVTTDLSITAMFGLAPDTQVLKLVRIRYGDGIPLSHEVAWYNLAAAPGLIDGDTTKSMYAQLADCGAPLAYAEQAIEAASPTADECKIFGFAGPIPCLLLKRRSYGHDAQMLEYVEGLFRGDLYTYRLKMRV